METLEKILVNHPFVQGLAPEHVQLIVGCAKNVVFEPGKYLFRENEQANSFYIIRTGKVAIEVYSPEVGSIIIQTLGEGDILGWSWLIPPYQWRFDARAVELTRVIELDGTCLRNKCENDPALGYEFMKRLANVFEQRLDAMRIQLLDLYGKK
ncbi:MAG: cyclic nucleotide-binding domain-containing protein [Ignavibacteria bacterium]|nr:cyclic nucleotide-binding domain-containing protein [Ignavibacteria bacterium]